MLDYRISEWNARGDLISVLERRPAWFPGPSKAQLGSGHDKPAEPVIQGIGQDEVGRLWVSTIVATDEWIKLWGAFPRIAGTAEVSADWGPPYDRLYETRIEVIDPVARVLIASAKIPYATVATLPNNQLVAYSVEASSGIPRILILSVRLAT
jgi:hypothetical protein